MKLASNLEISILNLNRSYFVNIKDNNYNVFDPGSINKTSMKSISFQYYYY